MKAEFKLASFEDLDALIKLCDECFDERIDEVKARRMFFKAQHDENQIYLVGYVNDELVAHTKITIIPTIYEEMGTFAILNHVCVKESYRRHDIALDMLNKVEQIARNKGCKTLKLWSANFRIPAHKCYLKFGFEKFDASFFQKEL